jgi:hypothetical protein
MSRVQVPLAAPRRLDHRRRRRFVRRPRSSLLLGPRPEWRTLSRARSLCLAALGSRCDIACSCRRRSSVGQRIIHGCAVERSSRFRGSNRSLANRSRRRGDRARLRDAENALRRLKKSRGRGLRAEPRCFRAGSRDRGIMQPAFPPGLAVSQRISAPRSRASPRQPQGDFSS